MSRLFYSTSEVADLFRLDRVTVYRWAKDGKIKAYAIGRNFKIPMAEVERLLREFGFEGLQEGLHRNEQDGRLNDFINAAARYGNIRKIRTDCGL